MRKKKEKGAVAAVCQLRSGSSHPFGALKGFVPLGAGEERIYRQLREAIPVLDAAVGKLVRLSGGFSVECANPEAQRRLEAFLATVPCGRGQIGIGNFLSGYLDSLLTYAHLRPDGTGTFSIMGMEKEVTWTPEVLFFGDMTIYATAEGFLARDSVSVPYRYTGDALPEGYLTRYEE